MPISSKQRLLTMLKEGKVKEVITLLEAELANDQYSVSKQPKPEQPKKGK